MPGKYDSGAFIPTTAVMDVSEIYSTEVTSPEFKELLVRLYQNFNNMAMAINAKDTAIYDTEEFVCGQTFFPNPDLDSSKNPYTAPTQRPVYRKVVSFGALPNNTMKEVGHGISTNSDTVFTRIYGVATKPTDTRYYLPVPNRDVKLEASYWAVHITTTSTMDAYTKTYIVLEYMKT